MSNYRVITDEKLLKEFIDWLPDLAPHETYYVCLLARRKYCKDIKQIKTDKEQLKRFTSNKERLFAKIRQLECPLGSYVTGNDHAPVPQEALALYITPNPRNVVAATFGSIERLNRLNRDKSATHNPHQEVMSMIQKSMSRKMWTTFDIDDKGKVIPEHGWRSIDDFLTDALGNQCYYLLETRGGYHVLVDPRNVRSDKRATWYKRIKAISDVTGDSVIPVPGTYQGGFTPHFVTKPDDQK